MKTKYLILIVLAISFSCTNTPKKITNVNDYEAYLELPENQALESALKDLEFWNQKLEVNPTQFPFEAKLASSYSHLFGITGQIEYLIEAENHLKNVIEDTHYNSPGYLKSLASNYISQHKFKEALKLLTKAELIGDHLEGTQKLLFDVHIELGNDEMAIMYLDHFVSFSVFDYLIRLAKWSDHQGNLEAAIKYMEQAKTIAETSNLPGIKKWAYTNIADFYGHGGQIQKSYQFYLKALELDPNDAYSKKGIAWIVYSYEKNPDEALRILNQVTQSYHAPDYYLLMAEIADFEGNNVLKNEQLTQYENAVKNVAYGAMYNKYNVLLYTDEGINMDRALTIAKIEFQHRPTPESYDLLAWAYYKQGYLNEALDIVINHIIDETYEPHILYHVAEIYKAAGMTKEVKPLKKELLGSLYELGPTMVAKINQL
jgi:tetratricopeptide (TPR) repeat protein